MHRLDARNRSTNTRHSTEGTYQPHSKHDCATGKNGKPCMYGLRSLSFQARLFRILHQIIFLLLHIHAMPDYIHMLVKIPPKISVSNFMGYLKGKSSLMIFERFANLKYKFGNKVFWTKEYYVSTVGLDTKKVQ